MAFSLRKTRVNAERLELRSGSALFGKPRHPILRNAAQTTAFFPYPRGGEYCSII